MSTSLVQLPTSSLGLSKAVAYGRVPVVGNILRQYQLADATQVAGIGLGEGEWDGIDRLWVYKKRIDPADTTKVHFHPGIDGVLGGGLAPTSTGGDSAVDAFFADMPAQLDRVTDSRLAVLWLKIPPDPSAVSAQLDWFAHYRTTKCRIFDASGNQTGYAFTTVPAWQALDMLIRTAIKPNALINEALTASEKAVIDFPSLVDMANYHSAALANGAPRWDTGIWFAQTTPLADALTQLMTMCRSYIIERAGKILFYASQPVASSFTITAQHVVKSGFLKQETDVRTAGNRLNGSYRDPAPRKVVGVTSIARVSDVCTVQTDATHPFLENDDIEIVSPVNGTFAGAFTITSIPDGTHFTYAQTAADATSAAGGYVGTPESRFTPDIAVLDHDNHALQVGPRVVGGAPSVKRMPVDMQMFICTREQARRALKYVAYSALGADATPYQIPKRCDVRCSILANDGTNALADVMPGKKVTLDKSVTEEFQGDYRVLETGVIRSGVGADGSPTIASLLQLKLLGWVDAALTDVQDDDQALTPMPARQGLIPLGQPDDAGNIVLPSSTPLNSQGSINPAVIGATAVMGVGYDGTGPFVTAQVVGGNIPLPDGSTIVVPSSGPTTYRAWAGVATAGATTYGLNVVWDVASGAVELQESVGMPTLATKALAYRDGKIAITVGAYNTTPAIMGGGGGSGGSGGSCFSGNTLVQTPDGDRRMDSLPEFSIVLNRRGQPRLARVIRHEFSGEMRHMGAGQFVTPDHLLADGEKWVAAASKYLSPRHISGTVFNLEIVDEPSFEEQHFALANGEVAHNNKVAP